MNSIWHTLKTFYPSSRCRLTISNLANYVKYLKSFATWNVILVPTQLCQTNLHNGLTPLEILFSLNMWHLISNCLFEVLYNCMIAEPEICISIYNLNVKVRFLNVLLFQAFIFSQYWICALHLDKQVKKFVKLLFTDAIKILLRICYS